jgi:hypothetical protein
VRARHWPCQGWDPFLAKGGCQGVEKLGASWPTIQTRGRRFSGRAAVALDVGDQLLEPRYVVVDGA